tara:strand:- start:315 stop:521 length:207 start_codon:yes stop_codon:yes gene_type:complete
MKGIETIKRISEAIELQREMEVLFKKMTHDLGECRNLLSPYCRRYGMERADLLNALLETYHQLRLKDD